MRSTVGCRSSLCSQILMLYLLLGKTCSFSLLMGPLERRGIRPRFALQDACQSRIRAESNKLRQNMVTVPNSGDGPASGRPIPLEAVLVDELLASAYADYHGDSMDENDQELVNAVSGKLGFVYGEITAQGLRRLAARVNLSQNDTFYDLGSGVGRGVLQAFLEFGVRRSVGIELASSRHVEADAAWNRMQAAGIRNAGGRVSLIQGDILQEDCSEATVMYCSSLCFSEHIMRALGLKLRDLPALRAVASLQRFPDGIPGFSVREEWEGLEMSWTVGKEQTLVRVFVYEAE